MKLKDLVSLKDDTQILLSRVEGARIKARLTHPGVSAWLDRAAQDIVEGHHALACAIKTYNLTTFTEDSEQ